MYLLMNLFCYLHEYYIASYDIFCDLYKFFLCRIFRHIKAYRMLKKSYSFCFITFYFLCSYSKNKIFCRRADKFSFVEHVLIYL